MCIRDSAPRYETDAEAALHVLEAAEEAALEGARADAEV